MIKVNKEADKFIKMSCEAQLDYFNASLSRRDFWAMRSESLVKIEIEKKFHTIKINKKHFLFFILSSSSTDFFSAGFVFKITTRYSSSWYSPIWSF